MTMAFKLERTRARIGQNERANGKDIIAQIIKDWKEKKPDTFHNADNLHTLIKDGFDDYTKVKAVSDWYLNDETPFRAFFKVHCNTLTSFVQKYNLVKEAYDCVQFEKDSDVQAVVDFLYAYYVEPRYKILYCVCQSYRQLKLFESEHMNDPCYTAFIKERVCSFVEVLSDWHYDTLNKVLLKEIVESWFLDYKMERNLE